MSKWLWLPSNGHPPIGTVVLLMVKGATNVRVNLRTHRLAPPDADGWCKVVRPVPVDEIDDVEFQAPSRAGVRFRFATKDGAVKEVDASVVPAHWGKDE